MKIFLLYIFLLVNINFSFSQISVKGRCIDLLTKEPVYAVYVQNNKLFSSTLTDENGFFVIDINFGDTISFHRVGYEQKTLAAEKDFMNIELSPIYFNLDEITISNETATNMVKKAVQNFKDNYCGDEIHYLWHGIEKEQNSVDSIESYAIYSTKIKKNRQSFDLGLLNLYHLLPLRSEIKSEIIKNNSFSIQFHPCFPDDWIKNGNDYSMVKQNSENDSLILINCKLKHAKKSMIPAVYNIVINKRDTTLLCSSSTVNNIESDSTEDEYNTLKFLFLPISKYKLRAFTTNLIINKKDDIYYFESFESKIIISFLVNKNEETIECTSSCAVVLGDSLVREKKIKKIPNSTSSLFKHPATTNQNFWKQYLKN
ncbi:MAG: carboxypeptidase-like regulatory domain-containing protein [Dysgonamonadaceae bacterium]|jgi:hypothetical protein|nr:carboxypeptidase-like regulatory domain-containing protein [Dysgonamonadaceae bacterium]